MHVLLIGSGAREHALAWRLAESPALTKLHAAPGNPGIGEFAECHSVAAGDVQGLVALCRREHIDFVVVGPELPLTLGLVDHLEAAGIKAFGPSGQAARLEGSKAFTKALCAQENIPTAAFGTFSDVRSAREFLARCALPIVVKADGLAAGKGVVIAQDPREALAALDELLAMNGCVVIEEFLRGEEVSFFALCDGERALPLTSAQDHKRVGEGETGPNTGGMGAYSPAPLMSAALESAVMSSIIDPTLKAMARRGTPFRGVLYAGLMISPEGEARLLEYNVRFGDPEAQVLMMRLRSDLLPALLATVDGGLGRLALDWHPDAALTVVMAGKGYPGTPETGGAIGLPPDLPEAVRIFQAATKLGLDGRLEGAGGRVLSVTARGKSVGQARDLAYGVVDRIDWPQGFCRRDIGWRAIQKEKGERR